jgi:sec-independent protein translocase protein TatA
MFLREPSHWIILLLVVLLVFGWKRLPDIARSVGQSLKVFKKEVSDLRDGDAPKDGTAPTDAAAPTTIAPQPAPPAATPPVASPPATGTTTDAAPQNGTTPQA